MTEVSENCTWWTMSYALFLCVSRTATIRTRRLYYVKCPQYSIRLEALSCPCASCLLRTVELSFNDFFKLNNLHICTSLLSWWTFHVTQWSVVTACLCSVVCRAVRPRLTSQKKFGEYLHGMYAGKGNDFELIQTVKMEIRLPVEGSFGNNL